MPRFAANLSMLFTEHAFLDRFDAAADAGFEAVEFLFPYDHTPEAVAERVTRNRLTVALFNLPPGDWDAGERGIASLPGRAAEFDAGLDRAADYIAATGVTRVHAMAGIADPADPTARDTYRRSLEVASDRLAQQGVTLLIEPINPVDMPGYFLRSFDLAEEMIAAIDRPNLKLQFDIYHRQRIHGEVTAGLRRLMPIVGHVQVASVPSRGEPDGEELNHPFLFAELDRLGYAGFVGAEYRPRGRTEDGLGWFAAARGRR